MKSNLKILVAALLALTPFGIIAQPTATITATDRNETVAGAIQQMNDHYVFPDVAKKVESALTRNLQNKTYDGLDDATRFAAKLTEDVQAVTADKHIRVRYSAMPVPPRTNGNRPSPEALAQMRTQAANVSMATTINKHEYSFDVFISAWPPGLGCTRVRQVIYLTPKLFDKLR